VFANLAAGRLLGAHVPTRDCKLEFYDGGGVGGFEPEGNAVLVAPLDSCQRSQSGFENPLIWNCIHEDEIRSLFPYGWSSPE